MSNINNISNNLLSYKLSSNTSASNKENSASKNDNNYTKTSLAYELSDSLVALINGTNNPSNNSINNLYSSLTTFNATKLSSDNFVQLQKLNESSKMANLSTQQATLLSSVDNANGLSTNAFQSILSTSNDASKLNIMIANDSSGTVLKDAVSQIKGSSIDLLA